MAILDDVAKMVEALRSMDRAELADELGRMVEKARAMDRSEVVDELSRLVEKVREVLLENHSLRRRLRARLQAGGEEPSYPYEGVYWFDSGR